MNPRLDLLLAALVFLAVAISSCGRDARIEHGNDPHELVLAYSEGGGLLPYPGPAGFERVLLYGDGRLLVAGPEGWKEMRLAEDGVQRLLRAAVVDARFFDQADAYHSPGCADCPTSTLTLRAGGKSKRIDAYALGLGPPDPAADTGLYRRLEALRELLAGIGDWPYGADELEWERAYQPPGVWLQAFEMEVFPPGAEMPGWPDTLPSLADFTEGGAVCDPLASEIRRFVASHGLPLMDRGQAYSVTLRELFPHDTDAPRCGL